MNSKILLSREFDSLFHFWLPPMNKNNLCPWRSFQVFFSLKLIAGKVTEANLCLKWKFGTQHKMHNTSFSLSNFILKYHSQSLWETSFWIFCKNSYVLMIFNSMLFEWVGWFQRTFQRRDNNNLEEIYQKLEVSRYLAAHIRLIKQIYVNLKN